jgi:hypothetical protein
LVANPEALAGSGRALQPADSPNGFGAGTSSAPQPPASAERAQRWALAGAALLLGVSALRTLLEFGTRYLDDDIAIIWFAAEEYRRFAFHEPFFFGQAYQQLWECFPAGLLGYLGAPPYVAVPLVAIAVGLAPWMLFAHWAFRRGAPLLSLLLVGGPILLPSTYLMLLTRSGYSIGILLVALGGYLLGSRPELRRAQALFGFFTILGLSANLNSAVLAAPLGAWALLRGERRRSTYLFALLGGAIAASLYGLGRLFYALHPTYNLHHQLPLRFDAELLLQGLGSLERHFGHFTPDLTRPGFLFLALFLLGFLAFRWKRPLLALPAAATLLILVLPLGLNKVHDGADALFFSYARIYLAAPLAVAFAALAIADAHPEALRPSGTAPFLLLALAIGTSFAFKQANLPAEAKRAAAIPSGNVNPRPLGDLLRDCGRLLELAKAQGAGLVVHLQDRGRGYGCGAILHGEIETLVGAYERRTWRLHEESSRAREHILFSEVEDDFCRRARPFVADCAMLGAPWNVAAVRTHGGETAVSLMQRLGLPQRAF